MYQLFLPVTTVKETAVMLLVEDVKKKIACENTGDDCFKL
jgi:hypothetical protein